MRKFWKKTNRKLAAALTVTLLAASVAPVTGLAGNYELGRIASDSYEITSRVERATASVALKAEGDQTLNAVRGEEKEISLYLTADVNVTAVSIASDSDASPSDASGSNWNESQAKKEIEEMLADNLTVKASITTADAEIADFLFLDDTETDQTGQLSVIADLREADIADGTYEAGLMLFPEIDPDFYDSDAWHIVPSQTYISLTIQVSEKEKEVVSDYTFFDGGNYIYVGLGETVTRPLSFDQETIKMVNWIFEGDAQDYFDVEYNKDQKMVTFAAKKSCDTPQILTLTVETDKKFYSADIRVQVNRSHKELTGIEGKQELIVGERKVIELPEWPEGILTESFFLDWDNEFLSAEFSSDYKTLILTAKVAGQGWVYFDVMDAAGTIYYFEIMIDAKAPGVKLELEKTAVYMEPGETVKIPVEYSPETAVLKTWIDQNHSNVISAEYEEEEKAIKITAAQGVVQFEGVVWLALYPSEAAAQEGEDVLAEQWIDVTIVEKQLELDGSESTAEILDKADEKLDELLGASSGMVTPEIAKLVTEVVDALVEKSAGELEDEENQDKIVALEEKLAAVVDYEDDINSDSVDSVEIVGAVLNLIYNGLTDGKVAIKDTEVPAGVTGSNLKSLDIKLQDKAGRNTVTRLQMPIWIKLKVDGIDLTKRIRINHILENGNREWIYPEVDGEQLAFSVRNFSTFVFMNYTSSGGSGGSGGSGSGGSSSAGTVSTDSKKGKINSLTGIIIGNGSGYSKWIQETLEGQTTVRWKLQYADGSMAAGSYLTDEQGNLLRDSAGNPIEQPLWELVSGAWYAFGADGYVKSGFVFDPSLNGWFYVDVNSGMKTGWQQIDGNWYYFNTSADGSRGIMYVNRVTPDGHQVNAEGIWVQ